MSDIRELAKRRFNEFADKYDQDSDEWLDMSVETMFVEGMIIGMREGMLRAAEISKLYANEEEESSSFQCGAAACERMIRAEADKLEGK